MRKLVAPIFLLIVLLLPQSVYAASKTKTVKPTPKPSYSCSVRKTVCNQMRSCDEAKFYYQSCGVRKLDRDNDGIPCEIICLKK